MKKILLVMSVIAVLFLAGCQNNDNVNNNVPQDDVNQGQEEIVENNQQQLIENDGNEVLSFSSRTEKAKSEYESLMSNEDYAIDYVTLKKDNNEYLLRTVFKRIIEYRQAEEFEENGHYVFDDSDVKNVDIKLEANDVLNVSTQWSVFDSDDDSFHEMPTDIKVSDLYDLELFSSDWYNGLWIEEITDSTVIIGINMAGLT